MTQVCSFDAGEDPRINHEMDMHSERIYVYGIDSAFMTKYDENGYPVMEEESGIYPLTLLIDDNMNNGSVRLAVPTSDDTEDSEPIIIDSPQYIHVI